MSSFAENKRAYLAEFFATTLFVWVGCGTAVASLTLSTVNDRVDNTFLTAVALAFGIGIAVLAYSIAPISGGHINPAVTFAFVLLGDFPLVKAAWYIAAQCLGAILGAALVYGSMLSQEETISNPPFLLGSNSVSPNLPVGSAFLAEAMGTFLLVWTVLMTAVHKKSIAGNIAPIAIGWSVLLAHLVLVPLTGCGINPARSLGPHLVSIMAGEKIGFEGWWVYYTAPWIGSALATLAYMFIFAETDGGDETKTGDKVVQKEEQHIDEDPSTQIPL